MSKPLRSTDEAESASRPPLGSWPRIYGVVLAVLLGSLSFGMNRVDTGTLIASIMSIQVWPFLVLSFGLIPVFVRVERAAAEPVLRLALIKRRQVALVCLFATAAGTVEAVGEP